MDRSRIRYILDSRRHDELKGVKSLLAPPEEVFVVRVASLARVPDKGLLGLREGIMFELDAVKRSYTQKPNAVDKRARQIARDKISKAARLSAELSTLLHGLNAEALRSLEVAALNIYVKDATSVFEDSEIKPAENGSRLLPTLPPCTPSEHFGH